MRTLRTWAAWVTTMRSAIKRDGLMLALYTGLRHDGVRKVCLNQVASDDETMHLPNPKGGQRGVRDRTLRSRSCAAANDEDISDLDPLCCRNTRSARPAPTRGKNSALRDRCVSIMAGSSACGF